MFNKLLNLCRFWAGLRLVGLITCLILVVITEDKSILENAPESLFSKYGIVDYYINHSDISNILKILFSKYSLLN